MKILFNFLLTTALLLLVFAGTSPYVLSTEWGREKFLQTFNYISKGNLQIGKLTLNWMGPQEIENIQYSSKDLTFSCQKIVTDAPLSQILFKHDIGEMTIESPQATLLAKVAKEKTLPPLEPMGLSFGASFENEKEETPSLAYHPLFKLGFFDWIGYMGELDLKKGEITFLNEKLPPLKFDQLDIHLSRLQKDELFVETHCQITEKDFSGTFNTKGSISHIGTPSQDITFESKFLNFPIRSIDQMVSTFQPELEGCFLSLIGDSLSAKVNIKSSSSALAIDIDASSSQFSAYARTKTNGEEISLHAPALFTWNLSPDAIKKLTGQTVSQDVTAILKINSLTLPIHNQRAFSFEAELSTSSLVLKDLLIEPAILSLSTQNFEEGSFTATVNSPQFSSSDIEFNWKKGFKLLKPALFQGTLEGTISSLEIPHKWEDISLDADLQIKTQESLNAKLKVSSIKEISLILQNNHFTADILGAFNPKDNLFTIKNPVDFTYHLTELPDMEAPADIQIQINPCTIPLSNIQKLHLTGKGSAKEILFKNHTLQDLTFSFEGSGKHQTLQIQAKGAVDEGTFNIEIDAKDTLPNTFVHITLEGSNIPADFIGLFLPQDVQTETILGKTLSLSLDGTSSPEQQTLSLQAKSENFTCELNLKQEKDKLKLLKPGNVSFNLTKENYASLEKWIAASPFEVTEGTTLQLTLTELEIPAKINTNRIPELTFDIQQVQLQGDGFIDKLSFIHKDSKETTTLNHLKIHLSQPSQKSPLAFQISGSTQPQGILSVQGQFDHLSHALSLNASLQQFPTAIFDIITHSELSLNTLFGPNINLTASTKIQENSGPLKLSLHSPHARASIEGLLTNGTLTLNDTIYAQITLTKEVGKQILKDVSPLSTTVLHADAPLTVEIPKEGFSLPLTPFSLKETTIPQIKIELGKILCENKGNLSDIVGILKLATFSQEKDLKVWFSPIALTLKEGVINIERTDTLIADTYQVCTWGTIDLINNNVDLVLGLTADCLKKAFRIKNLPETYVLQVPMTGPLNDVHVNTSLATTKVAALLLWEQRSKAGDIVGGSAGAVLGDLLGKIGPIPGGDSKAPPAHHPLPWEDPQGQLSSMADHPAESPKKKKHFKPKENALKQALKMVR